jgi:hypothetical protein
MDPATIIAILTALVRIAPQVPEIITGVETAIGLIQSGAAPTAAQQAEIDALLDSAHKAFQA